MNKRSLVLVAIAMLVVVFAAACAPAATAVPPSGALGQPVAAVQLAPICQGGSACQVPSAETYRLDCVKKVPYTNLVVDQGTTFEVLDKSGDFTCNQTSYVVDGKSVVSCYGKQLWGFDVKLTNSSCGGANLTAGTGQCQEGYGYDAAQQCCSPMGGDTAGSTVVRVELGACPVPHIEEPPTPEN